MMSTGIGHNMIGYKNNGKIVFFQSDGCIIYYLNWHITVAERKAMWMRPQLHIQRQAQKSSLLHKHNWFACN
jgi:hypothetical protein